MKRAAILAITLLAPCAARAQRVEVQAFTLQPPNQIAVTATTGQLLWRSCPTCIEESGRRISLIASGDEILLPNGKRSPQVSLTGSYVVSGEGAPSVTAQYPLRIWSRDGHVAVVFSMPLEDYVTAVLGAEGGDLRTDEARKAMAVAVRTYAERFRSQHAADGFDFCDTTHCQAVRWATPDPKARAASAATQGETLTFNGAPAAAYYHQNCGGQIASAKEVWPDSGQPYLAAHADPYCAAAQPLRWESSLSLRDLDGALRASGLNPPTGWTGVEIARRSESGRVSLLRFVGGRSGVPLASASSFRYAVGRALGWNKIRSDLYDIRPSGGALIFSGRGAGHGVGLCQAGAEQMGIDGKNYREILVFYYPGTQLSKASDVAWQKRFSDRFELDSVTPDEDAAILPMAARILKQDEDAAGWTVTSSRIRLQLFPTLDVFRDTTGQPGWVAASTRGNVIRLQPLAQLRSRSILESTLRHELLHVLVESRATAGLPLWFREGLVLYFSGELSGRQPPAPLTDAQVEAILKQPRSQEEAQHAYAAAELRVGGLIERDGRATVLQWLSRGLPRDIGSEKSPAQQ